MVVANQVPRVVDTISAERPKEQHTLMEAERQALLLDKLDLSGLQSRQRRPMVSYGSTTISSP